MILFLVKLIIANINHNNINLLKLKMKNKILIITIITMLLTSVVSAKTNSNKKSLFKPAVNKFAWYAALQTINFMPIAAADPFGGVILTNWYGVSDSTRYKIDVYINEGLLTANAVTVKVFKQNKNGNNWVDEPISAEIASKIEDAILTTARQLKIENSLN